LSNGVRLFWKLKVIGVRTELITDEGMWHYFTSNIDISESIRCRKAVQVFMVDELKKAGDGIIWAK
jgi:hypothetical protein